MRDQAGSRSLVFDLSITHERFGSSSHAQQNGHLTHPQDIDAPLRLAAQRKINSYSQQCADNQNFFSSPFSAPPPACTANFGVFFFYRPTGDRGALQCHCLPSQCSKSDSFCFKRAAFFQGLKSKIGLAAAKVAALRINLNIDGCGVVAPPMHL